MSECPDVKNYKWRLNPGWRKMLYSCTRMATVGAKRQKERYKLMEDRGRGKFPVFWQPPTSLSNFRLPDGWHTSSLLEFQRISQPVCVCVRGGAVYTPSLPLAMPTLHCFSSKTRPLEQSSETRLILTTLLYTTQRCILEVKQSNVDQRKRMPLFVCGCHYGRVLSDRPACGM